MMMLACLSCLTSAIHPRELERSFWLHASLASAPHRGYWGTELPASEAPREEEVAKACDLLTGRYAANRLYLIYHCEIPLADAKRVFHWWREYSPSEMELVPTLPLKMYDPSGSPVFATGELRDLAGYLKQHISATRAAVYDVYPNRDQGEGLALLESLFPAGLIRVGLQPHEEVPAPFVAAVEDTWSGVCHGKTQQDWEDVGFGRETLRDWIAARNRGTKPIVWDLIVVAWDYTATERGSFPGYDDAEKNMPLPPGRNLLAAQEILNSAGDVCFRGFSSDLFILQANSWTAAHDGPEGSFYDTLKRGEVYQGYYREPFHEIISIFQALERGEDPRRLALPVPPAESSQ